MDHGRQVERVRLKEDGLVKYCGIDRWHVVSGG